MTYDQNRTGYLSLPPELRSQIIEHILSTGPIRPYSGQTAHHDWQRDYEIVTEAHAHAWKDFICHPSRRSRRVLSQMLYSYLFVLVADCPTLCISAMDIAPHFLSVCQTTYHEGHSMFYSQNAFHLPVGPLSHTKGYFDNLRSEHRKLIRRMVLDLSIYDLNISAFDAIEKEVRAKDVVKGRLPPDRSVEDWTVPITYNLISTWRSKLAWLRDWTWVPNVVIASRISRNLYYAVAGRPNPNLDPFANRWRLSGSRLPVFLKGVGPAMEHVPVMSCYGECDKQFAQWMNGVELDAWYMVQRMIKVFGWRCSKSLIRRAAYKLLKE
ncbi:MAG: hypothetical protein Q9219_004118 [cf. Caloplaca sp. 3 TL-2023]